MRNVHPSRTLLACIAALAMVAATASHAPAQDDPAQRIERMAEKAMESFDALEYEVAKKLLNQALVVAETNNLENDLLVAKVHLNLGIIHFSGDPRDVDSARLEFIKAVKIDAEVEIDAVYSTPEMRELLDEVREKYGNFDTGPKIDCSELSGLQHEHIDQVSPGQDREVQAALGLDINASKMSLHYRMYGVDGAKDEFEEVEMEPIGNCKYKATLPGSSIVAGGVMHYYIAAYNKSGRMLTSKGSEGSPNIIDVVKVVGDENPDLGKPVVPVKNYNFFIAAKPGTGGAFITGNTEQLAAPVNCCFAPALFHIWIEAGYFLSPKLSVGGAFRLGFPIGANLENHATGAPAGLLRLRYALSEDGQGLVLSGVFGGGVMRQTIKLEDVQDPGMDTDTTAIGPLFIGGGVGFSRSLGGPVRFSAEADVTAGIPVVGEIGTARLNFGIQFDLNLGVMVAF